MKKMFTEYGMTVITMMIGGSVIGFLSLILARVSV